MKKKSIVFVSALLALLATSATAVVTGIAPPPRAALPDNILDPLFAADQGETRGALLIVAGQPVRKRYAPGYSDANRFISWSMAKTVTAVLVGELIEDGKLSLDAPVPFAEWQQPGDPRAAITLRQMLQMSSGIDHSEVSEPVYASDTNQTLFVGGTQAMAAAALSKPLQSKPGTVFEYSSLTSLLLAELITRTLTPSKDPRVRAAAYTSFAQDRLFTPAGITSAVMDFDGAGTQIGGSIIYMTLDDWGRFGKVLLSGGGEDGKALITPAWRSFLITPSPVYSGYGGQTWLNRPRPGSNDAAMFPGGPATLFSANGHLGQYVIVSPDQDMVLVRLGKTNDPVIEPVRKALGKIAASVEPKVVF